jgi:hypothetical protein
VVKHTAQAGNQPIAVAEEARRATTGRVWATFMVVVGSVKEARHEIDGCGSVRNLVLFEK